MIRVPVSEPLRASNNAALASVLTKCSELLHPKLRRLLNPNVVDSWVRLQLHFQAGALNHLREADGEPSYVNKLPEMGQDNPYVLDTLKVCLSTLKGRLDGKIGSTWHGVITLRVDVSGGAAVISSEVDGVYRPNIR